MDNIDKETWNQFRRHCLSQQQLNPESTIPETIRKLLFLEREGIDLNNFTQEGIYNYFAIRLENGATYTALNHSIKALNRWNKFIDNDFKFQRYKEDKKPMKVPNTEEIHKMLNQCKGKNRIDKRNRTIILLLAKTGMRNKEICNLKLTDIDWQRKEITIRNSKHNKTRIIPIDDKMLFGRTYPSLKNYIKHWRMKTSNHYVFTTNKGKMTPNYLRRIIKIISQKAGIYWIHPHSFRHYAATNLLRAGVNIRVVQAILGHSSIRTTGNYLHVIENDLHQAIANPHIEDPLKTRPYKLQKCLAKPLLM